MSQGLGMQYSDSRECTVSNLERLFHVFVERPRELEWLQGLHTPRDRDSTTSRLKYTYFISPVNSGNAFNTVSHNIFVRGLENKSYEELPQR